MEKVDVILSHGSARVIYSARRSGAAEADVLKLEWVPEPKRAPLEQFPTCQSCISQTWGEKPVLQLQQPDPLRG